jgi:hypothetical protein
MRRTLVAFATVALAVVAGVPVSAATTSDTSESSLKVTISWGPGTRQVWTLRCDPPGGTHPAPVRACASLERMADPFSNLPTGVACSMIYSGPERARVVGRWKGVSVDTTFARTNGCETARWRQYRALLTDPGSVSVRGSVHLGPTCPVQRPGENCEIDGAPARVTANSAALERSTVSGVDGFLLRLPRARWTITADAGMHCDSVIVDTRRALQPIPLVISCDTGIRAIYP